MSGYMKILCDIVEGGKNFPNELAWYGGGRGDGEK